MSKKKLSGHFQYKASVGDIQKTRMTDKKHRQIEKQLIALLDSGKFVVEFGDDIDAKLHPSIIDAIKRSVVGPTPKSSGMFPVPENPPVWGVGCFGSVWTDLLADDVLVRVSWYEKAPSQLYANFPPQVDTKTLLAGMPKGTQRVVIVSDSPEAKKISDMSLTEFIEDSAEDEEQS